MSVTNYLAWRSIRASMVAMHREDFSSTAVLKVTLYGAFTTNLCFRFPVTTEYPAVVMVVFSILISVAARAQPSTALSEYLQASVSQIEVQPNYFIS